MTRLHPFAYFAEIADEWFALIVSESEAQHRDPRDRVQFAALPTVQRALQAIEDPAFLEKNPEAAQDYLAVLSRAFTYWYGGQRTMSLPKDGIAPLLADPRSWASAPGEDVEAYVQFPQHLFWAQIEDGAPHEPIDGLFVSANAGAREVSVLAVLGLREDRDNFSQVHITAAFSDLGQLVAELPTPIFEPVVEDAAAAGVKSVNTAGEMLALALIGLAGMQDIADRTS